MTIDEKMKAAKAKFIGPKAKDFALVLNSPSGRAVMKELERVFWDGQLFGKDEREQNRILGAREVVRYLREMRDYNEGTGNDNG